MNFISKEALAKCREYQEELSKKDYLSYEDKMEALVGFIEEKFYPLDNHTLFCYKDYLTDDEELNVDKIVTKIIDNLIGHVIFLLNKYNDDDEIMIVKYYNDLISGDIFPKGGAEADDNGDRLIGESICSVREYLYEDDEDDIYDIDYKNYKDAVKKNLIKNNVSLDLYIDTETEEVKELIEFNFDYLADDQNIFCKYRNSIKNAKNDLVEYIKSDDDDDDWEKYLLFYFVTECL